MCCSVKYASKSVKDGSRDTIALRVRAQKAPRSAGSGNSSSASGINWAFSNLTAGADRWDFVDVKVVAVEVLYPLPLLCTPRLWVKFGA
jgi:hypothetical protein